MRNSAQKREIMEMGIWRPRKVLVLQGLARWSRKWHFCSKRVKSWSFCDFGAKNERWGSWGGIPENYIFYGHGDQKVPRSCSGSKERYAFLGCVFCNKCIFPKFAKYFLENIFPQEVISFIKMKIKENIHACGKVVRMLVNVTVSGGILGPNRKNADFPFWGPKPQNNEI